jgi:hypothetical protein
MWNSEANEPPVSLICNINFLLKLSVPRFVLVAHCLQSESDTKPKTTRVQETDVVGKRFIGHWEMHLH